MDQGVGDYDMLYVYKSDIPPTTTTTTTLAVSSSSSSETEIEESSSSSGEGPTTTTTTTEPPLTAISVVNTVVLINGKEVEISDASDSELTIDTPFAKSLTFGTLAPKEVSETMVVALRVPQAQSIRNVRLGLIDTGGLDFTIDTFGIYSSYQLDNNVIPSTYFQGINEEKLASSPYNAIINTINSNTSDYVYLNVKMPDNNFIGTGTIRYKWWFDYSD